MSRSNPNIPSGEQQPKVHSPGKKVANWAVGATIAVTSVYFSGRVGYAIRDQQAQREHPTDQASTPTATAPELTPSATPEATPPSSVTVERHQPMSFNSLRSSEALPANTAQNAAASTLRVETAQGSCTGTIINGYLLTAGHCAPESGKAMDIKTWQDGLNKKQGTLSAWSIKKPVDLLVGKLAWRGSEVTGLHMPFFSNEAPKVGQRFIMSSLPGDAKQPVIAPLTFLFEDPATEERSTQWVFAVDPETPLTTAQAICRPGASGSTIQDGKDHIAVVTSGVAQTKTDAATWQNVLKYSQQKTDSDLAGVTAFCYATAVTRDTFNDFIKPLG